MPKFIIYEERHDVYTCTIEADSLEHAKQLYDDDPEEIFGDQWEQEGGNGVDLNVIVELAEDGMSNKTTHVYENGELMDSIGH